MRYYCNVCKRDITKDEFLYSIKHFDQALCREHQHLERTKIKEEAPSPPPSTQTEQEQRQKNQEIIEQTTAEQTRSEPAEPFWKSSFKKIGKGIADVTKKLIDKSKQTLQIQRWKEQILRRMDYSLLKSLCREKNIATKITKTEIKENKDGGFYYKDYPYTYTYDELVGRLKLRVKLDEIISFAKRNHINIRDIIQNIETTKSQWQLKEFTEEDHEEAHQLLTDIQKAIHEYTPQRRYYQEILYQDTLATHLSVKLPGRDVRIERQKGSSRPDIVIDNVAIEIKGPTDQRGLDSVPSKCMRYKMHFPGGLIVVLFDVQTTDYYYDEWLKGIKRTHPNVIVIRK